MIVRICERNEAAKLAASSFSGTSIRIFTEPCLRRCGVCRRTPYAVVDGVTVEAATVDGLAGRIRQLYADSECSV